MTHHVFGLFIALTSLIFVACNAVGSSEACYINDYKIISVKDKNGDVFEPERFPVTFVFNVFGPDICGISPDAVPMQSDSGFARGYPYFLVAEVEDTRMSLSGQTRGRPDFVNLGTQYRGEFSDDLPMWPLYNSEWRENE